MKIDKTDFGDDKYGEKVTYEEFEAQFRGIIKTISLKEAYRMLGGKYEYVNTQKVIATDADNSEHTEPKYESKSKKKSKSKYKNKD